MWKSTHSVVVGVVQESDSWVHLDFGCYAFCLVMLGLEIGRADWWSIRDKSQPNRTIPSDGPPCTVGVREWGMHYSFEANLFCLLRNEYSRSFGWEWELQLTFSISDVVQQYCNIGTFIGKISYLEILTSSNFQGH